MRVYVAGPMTHIPQFNFPAFDDASTSLRERGYEVVSPAELDDPEERAWALQSADGSPDAKSPKNETWGDYLARDVKLVADQVDAIVALPGWENSRGARLETFVAMLCGKPIYLYSQRRNLQKVTRAKLNAAWIGEAR